MDLYLWIAAKPRFLRIKDPRIFQVESRRDGRRGAATAPIARLPAEDEARYLGDHRLERSDRVATLIASVSRRGRSHRLVESRFHGHDRECRLIRRDFPVERDLAPPLVERYDRLRFIQLRHHENVRFARPRLAMLLHGHVELQRSNRGERAEHLTLASTGQPCHALEQRSTVLRSQISRELQLVLLIRRRAHVALEMLPRRLVVHRLRHQPRDPGQRDALIAC